MALFKTFKGLSSSLMTNKPNAVEGYAYFTTDDGKFYIDIATSETAEIGTNRIPLSADFANRIPYAINTQNSTIYNKIISTNDPFELKEGSLILIKFTAGTPGGTTDTTNIITFNINSTGQKNVYYRGARIPNEFLVQNKIYLFRVNTYHNSNTNQDEFIYDLVGDVIPELGNNKSIITNDQGMLAARDFTDAYRIVNELPDGTNTDIDTNVVYLVPTGEMSGGSGNLLIVTYSLTRNGNNVVLTGTNNTTSTIEALNAAGVQNLIDNSITVALSAQY